MLTGGAFTFGPLGGGPVGTTATSAAGVGGILTSGGCFAGREAPDFSGPGVTKVARAAGLVFSVGGGEPPG